MDTWYVQSKSSRYLEGGRIAMVELLEAENAFSRLPINPTKIKIITKTPKISSSLLKPYHLNVSGRRVVLKADKHRGRRSSRVKIFEIE